MSKATAQRRHAKRRLAERFGVEASNRDLAEWVAAIRLGRARFVERQSLRVTVWDVDHNGRTIRLVYDKHRGEIVTALFPENPGNLG